LGNALGTNAVVEVDDRVGGTVRMPGNPWIFGRSASRRPVRSPII
jgi:hypothetical protein